MLRLKRSRDTMAVGSLGRGSLDARLVLQQVGGARIRPQVTHRSGDAQISEAARGAVEGASAIEAVRRDGRGQIDPNWHAAHKWCVLWIQSSRWGRPVARARTRRLWFGWVVARRRVLPLATGP